MPRARRPRRPPILDVAPHIHKAAGPRDRVVAADIGGTFTDLVIQERGQITRILKLLTTPRRPSSAVISAVRQLGGEGARELLHATTLGTNALLSPDDAALGRVGLLTTEGFKDVIEIGRQNRPGLYDLFFQRPRTLVNSDRRLGISERTNSAGTVVRTVRASELRSQVDRLTRRGVRSLAISFLHAYANPANERRARQLMRGRFPFVSLSSEVAPEPREFERTSTTVVNALLMPVISEYIAQLEKDLRACGIRSASVMASSGGLISLGEATRRPVQIVESGPAAGVVAAAELGRHLGVGSIISFDMGGTTAKAGTVVQGRIELTPELEVGGDAHHGRRSKGTGYPIRFPFVDLAEVSAGGGTIIRRDSSGTLRVGPQSAGSEPGPASYGRGGTAPTLTDVNLVTGVLAPRLLGGSMALDVRAAARALATLGPAELVAEQALALANLEMARAIRIVTVERGVDPRSFTLVAFGGAGPQHAAAIAEEIGIRQILIPRDPGVLSATGLLVSDWRFEARVAFPGDLARAYRRLKASLRQSVDADSFLSSVDCRYEGQGSELSVPLGPPIRESVIHDFERLHERTFGFRMNREVELVTLRVFAVRNRKRPSLNFQPKGSPNWGERTLLRRGRKRVIKSCEREGLVAGTSATGPLAIEEYGTTTYVPASWRVTVLPEGQLRLWQEGS